MACNLGTLGLSQTQNLSPLGTSAAQTIEAMSAQLTMAAPSALASPVVTQLSQSTLAVTGTPQPSFTPLSTVPTVAVTQGTALPCDRVDFLADISVRDYTNFNPGTTFTKTWELRNTGSCTWNSSYSLVFDSGNSMSGPASVALPGLVAPGQVVNVSVTLQAPYNYGTYQGFWKLQDPSGIRFGIGANSASPIWVLITVGATPVVTPTSTSQASGVSCSLVSVSPAVYHQYLAGSDFDSKWVIENTGSTTWDSSEVDFKYISGTKMYKYNSIYDLAADVKVDHQITLIVDSIAPKKSGTYTMNWGLVQGSTRLCTMSVTIEVK